MTISCSIGVVSVGKALIDLGASINLMSLSMCRRIGNLRIAPTRMTLQLAGRSITRPYGVVECSSQSLPIHIPSGFCQYGY